MRDHREPGKADRMPSTSIPTERVLLPQSYKDETHAKKDGFRPLLILRLIPRGLIRLRRSGRTSSAISACRLSYQRSRPSRFFGHSGNRQRNTFSVPGNDIRHGGNALPLAASLLSTRAT